MKVPAGWLHADKALQDSCTEHFRALHNDMTQADMTQCALKLWRLQNLFKRMSREWRLELVVSGTWPALGLIRNGIVLRRRIELRLQSAFLVDSREFYEFGFSQYWPAGLGGGQRQNFCCGRVYPDDLLCETRVRRELAQKALLLGLATDKFGKSEAKGHIGKS